jgi:hypothetical protein
VVHPQPGEEVPLVHAAEHGQVETLEPAHRRDELLEGLGVELRLGDAGHPATTTVSRTPGRSKSCSSPRRSAS